MSAPTHRAISVATASNTSDGSTPPATSAATRRRAACSPTSRRYSACRSPSFTSLAHAPGSSVPLADSMTEVDEWAVIGKPSHSQRQRTPPATSPAFQTLYSSLFTLSLVCSPVWWRPVKAIDNGLLQGDHHCPTRPLTSVR